MGHQNVWNSHPKTYGPGSRACCHLSPQRNLRYQPGLIPFCATMTSENPLIGIMSGCRVCGNPHAIIRKYGLMCCRQCFRSNAKEIGFIKYR